MIRWNHRALARCAVLALAALFAPTVGTAQARTASTLRTSVYAAAFDSTVAAIGRTWVDTMFLDRHWLPAARAARDSAFTAPTDSAFRAVLRSLLRRIPASHFYLMPAPDSSLSRPRDSIAAPGRPGLALRLSELHGLRQLVVSRVDSGGPAARAGVRPGAAVRRIDGRDLGAAVQRLPALGEPGAVVARAQLVAAANALLAGSAGDARVLEFAPAATGPTPPTSRLRLDVETRRLQQFGNLPPTPAEVRARAVPLARGAAAVVQFDLFLPALMPALDDALFAARHCSALILDLRGNPGGIIGMIGGIAGHVLSAADTLAVLTMRGSTYRLVANPRTVQRDGTTVGTFDGPVVLLMDEASASASEILAGALQALGRARVVGTRSAGMALPAHLRRLPTGDVLVHATADLTGPRGQRAEGEGLTPDLAVPLDPAQLAAGGDPALDAALAALRGDATLRPAGRGCRF